MEDEEQPKKFRFKDNRRFDTEGNDREDSGAAEMAESIQKKLNEKMAAENISAKIKVGSMNTTTEEKPTAKAEAATMREAESGEEISFASFFISLATQALMQMGAMPPPDGIALPKDLAAAKQTIDILAMLQQKTRGNLSAEEGHMAEDVLHNLRMAFIQQTQRK